MKDRMMPYQLIYTIFTIVFIQYLKQIDKVISTRTFDTRLTIFIHFIHFIAFGLILSLPKSYDLIKNKSFGLNIKFLALELVLLAAAYIFTFRPPRALYASIDGYSSITYLCIGFFLPWCFSNNHINPQETPKEPPS